MVLGNHSRGTGRRRSVGVVAAAAAGVCVTAFLGACSPSGGSASPDGSASGSPSEVSTDVAAAGAVELVVLDAEGKDSGRGRALEAVNVAFMAKYPNVSVVRQAVDFTNYQSQAKLTLSADDAPCVAEGNQGYALDSTLVSGGLIRPLDDYAKAYGWSDKVNETLLSQFRFTQDGKTYGQGSIYGLAPAGEIVGWYYNKALLKQIGASVPTNADEFEAVLEKAKASGVQPIVLGNKDKWPASHVVMSPAMAVTDPAKTSGIVYGDASVKWADLGIEPVFDLTRTWVEKGFIESGYDGQSYDEAVAKFYEGKALFLNGGSWLTADADAKLGKDAGFFVYPGTGGNTAATGGLSLPFHVTTKCKTPDVAAAYIDYLVGQDAQKAFFEQSDLPVNMPSAAYPAGTVAQDVLVAFQAATKAGTLQPYMDWSTTTIGDVGWSGLQEMLAGRISAAELIAILDKDRDAAYADQ